MALSETVQGHIDDAVSSLRSAIALAARNERPSVIYQLSEILRYTESVSKIEKETDQLDVIKKSFINTLMNNREDGNSRF